MLFDFRAPNINLIISYLAPKHLIYKFILDLQKLNNIYITELSKTE